MALFTHKADHPLAELKEAKRILQELASFDAVTAIEQATAFAESLATTKGFKVDARFERFVLLEDSLLQQERRLTQSYLGLASNDRTQELRLWRADHDYWSAIARGYDTCISEYTAQEKGSDELSSRFAELCARALNAWGSSLKWEYFHYSPPNNNLWEGAGRAYLAAEAAGVKNQPLLRQAVRSSVDAEYLRIIATHVAAPDGLTPLEISITEVVAQQFVGQFSISQTQEPQCSYWIDCTNGYPPTRTNKPPAPSPYLRFFKIGNLSSILSEQLKTYNATNMVPQNFTLAGLAKFHNVIRTLTHLSRTWSLKLPTRKGQRRSINSRVALVSGLAALRERIVKREGYTNLELLPIKEIGEKGLRVQLPVAGGGSYQIGTLVGLWPEGGQAWLIGVLRRLMHETTRESLSGIEVIARSPQILSAVYKDKVIEGLLLDPPKDNTMVRAVIPTYEWKPAAPIFFALDGKQAILTPKQLLENQADYVIAVFTLQISNEPIAPPAEVASTESVADSAAPVVAGGIGLV